jgi:uncharacterized Tic20 family protein
VPRGHTLRTLAQSLDVPLETLTGHQLQEDYSYLKILRLSALAFWVFPLGNIIAPYVLWIMKRDSVESVYDVGRQVINFQVAWSVAVYGLLVIVALGSVLLHFDPVILFCAVALMLLLAVANTVMIVVQAVRTPRARTAV